MEIILLERIEKLGGIGDVVTVKNGFARNFLLPNNKALRANDANRKLFEANRSKIEADNAERRTDAEGRAKDIDGKQVVLIGQARQRRGAGATPYQHRIDHPDEPARSRQPAQEVRRH